MYWKCIKVSKESFAKANKIFHFIVTFKTIFIQYLARENLHFRAG